MGSAYIEALNAGLIHRRESLGELRDQKLLRETARLNRCLRREPEVVTEHTVVSKTTTIPPPGWRKRSS
jgi:hypothetical protein